MTFRQVIASGFPLNECFVVFTFGTLGCLSVSSLSLMTHVWLDEFSFVLPQNYTYHRNRSCSPYACFHAKDRLTDVSIWKSYFVKDVLFKHERSTRQLGYGAIFIVRKT